MGAVGVREDFPEGHTAGEELRSPQTAVFIAEPQAVHRAVMPLGPCAAGKRSLAGSRTWPSDLSEVAVSSPEVSYFPAQELNLGSLDESQTIRG